MKFNFLVIALAALIPLVIGAVWYNPKVLGTAWMNANGFNNDYKSKNKIGLIMLLSYVFNFFLGSMLMIIVIHQFGFFSTLMSDPTLTEVGSETYIYAQDFMERFGGNFRTFKHGAFHGIMFALFTVLPIVGTHALYESKSYKYVLIHLGYWTVSLALMGGVICQFA